MKVKMKVSVLVDGHRFLADSEAELDDAMAARLIRNGLAVASVAARVDAAVARVTPKRTAKKTISSVDSAFAPLPEVE